MSEKIPFNVNELVEKPWNKMAVYILTDEQKQQLVNHKKLVKREYFFRKGNKWDEHYHKESQILLLIKGQLTHKAKNMDYVQNPNDLLIVPANLPHSAYANKDLHLYWFTKK
ncbi:MAG: AraC family ligand binding domain-containing protein [Nanoarchaeota archaeon]